MEEGSLWEELNFDCLQLIFSKLGLEDLTLGVPFVCKSWHRASSEPDCWKILDFTDIDFTARSKFIPRFKEEYHINNFSFTNFLKLTIARSCGSVIELSVPSKLDPPLMPCLKMASNNCPRLKVLSLPVLLHQDDTQISRLIQGWKELEKLEMKWKPYSFLELLEEIEVNCPNFTSLNLRGSFDIKDANAIVKCLPRLKTLSITESFLRRHELVKILDGLNHLQKVDVSRCRGFDSADAMVKMASAGLHMFVSEACESWWML